MNEIQIFQNVEFGAIRTMSNEQGEVMFCAKDVALALGYKKPEWAIAKHVEEDDSAKRGVIFCGYMFVYQLVIVVCEYAVLSMERNVRLHPPRSIEYRRVVG